MIIGILDCTLMLLAASTVAYEVVLFAKLAAWIFYPLFIFCCSVIYLLFKKYNKTRLLEITRFDGLGLCIVAAVCVCINLFILRPDADDFSFFHRALLAAQNLSQPISQTANALVFSNLSPLSPVHLTTSIELFTTFTATVFGIDPLLFIHNIFGSITLVIFTVILFAFFRMLEFSSRSALLGTIITVSIYAFSGDMHADWGNFTLVRSWQGKTMYMLIFAPLVSMLTIQYLNEEEKEYTPRIFLRLHLAAIGSVGATGSGVFLYPFAVFSIFFIWFVMSKNKKACIPPFFYLLSTLSFTLIVILGIKAGLVPQVTDTTVWSASQILPENLQKFKRIEWASLKQSIFHTYTTIIFYGVALFGRILFFQNTKKVRLFLYSSFWMLICVVTPPISSTIIKITLPNPYWRLVYITNALIIISFFILSCLLPQTQGVEGGGSLLKLRMLKCKYTKIFFIIGCAFFIGYYYFKVPAVQSNLFAKPQRYKVYSRYYSDLQKCTHIIPKNVQGICYEELVVWLGCMRPDLRFYTTRYPDTMHTFLNSFSYEKTIKLLKIFEDMDQCGRLGIIKKYLDRTSNIDFIILAKKCSQEELELNMHLYEKDWEFFDFSSFVLMLRKSCIENSKE